MTAILSLVAASCSKAPVVNVEISTGQETGSFSANPRVVRVDIVATTVDNKTSFKASAKPGEAFDLGDVPDSLPLTFELTGVGADGAKLARGRSVAVPALGTISGGKLSLFMQRLCAFPGDPRCGGFGSFARPQGGLPTSHVRGQATVFQDRYLFLTGGESAADATGPQNTQLGDSYDMLSGGGAETSSAFTRNAGSIVVRGNTVLMIDKDGATWFDLSTAAKSDAAAPDGLTYAEVVGGRAIDTPSGATWIVGATRDADPPTKAILVVGADSTLSARTMVTARSGAAAAWIANVGLVVAGGADDLPGVEEIPDSGTAIALPYPADPTRGAALANAANGLTNNVVMMGGVLSGAAAPTRTIDLGCVASAAGCAGVEATDGMGNDATIRTLSARSQAFAITGAYLVVGDDPSGQSHCFRVTPSPPSAIELPFRDPRIGASAVAAPNGTLAVIGGTLSSGAPATSVELYFPE